MKDKVLPWQDAVDSEVRRISLESLDWIHSLPMHSYHKFEFESEMYNAVLQYLPKDNSRKLNSFMLSLQTRVSPLVYRSYCSGFFFEEDKVIEFSTNELELSDKYKT